MCIYSCTGWELEATSRIYLSRTLSSLSRPRECLNNTDVVETANRLQPNLALEKLKHHHLPRYLLVPPHSSKLTRARCTS